MRGAKRVKHTEQGVDGYSWREVIGLIGVRCGVVRFHYFEEKKCEECGECGGATRDQMKSGSGGEERGNNRVS